MSTFSCDGGGSCAAKAITECAPFACRSATCLTVCTSDADCVGGLACGSDGHCAPNGGASCVDDHTARNASGVSRDCSPYKCLDGRCASSCEQTSDCVNSNTCDGNHVCGPAISASGGCATSSGGRTEGFVGWSALVVAALAAHRAHKRHRRA